MNMEATCCHRNTVDTGADLVCRDCGLVIDVTYSCPVDVHTRSNETLLPDVTPYRKKEMKKRQDNMAVLASSFGCSDAVTKDMQTILEISASLSVRGKNKILMDIVCLYMSMLRMGMGISAESFLYQCKKFYETCPRLKSILCTATTAELQLARKKVIIHCIKSFPERVYYLQCEKQCAATFSVNICKRLKLTREVSLNVQDKAFRLQKVLRDTNIHKYKAIAAHSIMDTIKIALQKVCTLCDCRALDVQRIEDFLSTSVLFST